MRTFESSNFGDGLYHSTTIRHIRGQLAFDGTQMRANSRRSGTRKVTIFTFDTGPIAGNGTKQQLRTINLVGVAGVAGTTIITKAVRSATNGGDGFAAIGQIDATGIDIGLVTIDGDLGRILAGDATTTTQGLGALTVHSMGRFGAFTGAGDLTSDIQGAVASLTVKTDIREANFRVQGGASATLAAVTIGGSLIGGAASTSGSISSDGNMGPVKITGNVVGGGGSLSGTVQTQSNLASIAIGGSLIGGSGNNSAFLNSGAAMGAVTITGSILGGTGAESGWIFSPGTLTSVTVGGSVVAGTGNGSAAITSDGNMGAVKVTGDVIGSAGSRSGRIASDAKLASVTIGGSLIGSGRSSGQVFSGLDMGPVVITGDVRGGSINAASSSEGTGAIKSNGKLASVTIGGSLIGGSINSSGLIEAAGVDGLFGNADDVITSGLNDKNVATVFSRITSIVIGGQVLGTNGGIDHFGFVAQNIGSFKVKNGVTTFPMLAGNGNDDHLVGLFGDLRVNEIEGRRTKIISLSSSGPKTHKRIANQGLTDVSRSDTIRFHGSR